jgi:hypothetical protein
MHTVPGRMPRRVLRAAGVALGLGLALIAGGNVFRAAPQGQTRAFLILESDMGLLYAPMEQECPQGFEMTVEETFLSQQTPAERERLLRPENAKELAGHWKGEFMRGPGGENICNNPKSFMNDPRHPVFRGTASKVAYGLDLDGTPDGRATPNTCGHQKFVGVNGEPGIDNQLYRAVGCSKLARSTMPQTKQALDPFLIEIRGLDDPKNDDHVEVGIYSPEDTPMQGSDGIMLPNQTLGVTTNPHWRTTVSGRIVDGQLTTDVIPVVYMRWILSTWGVFGTQDHEFRDVRFRMSLQPDGTLKGLMASYRPIENIFTVGRCCAGTASVANNDCASEHKTLVMMADGNPDPATGQCTTISSANNFRGVPVFLVSPRGQLSTRQ